MIGNNPRNNGNPMATFGRRSTDATAEQVAYERAVFWRRVYTTLAIVSAGAGIAFWSWQASFIFIGLSALIASIATSD